MCVSRRSSPASSCITVFNTFLCFLATSTVLHSLLSSLRVVNAVQKGAAIGIVVDEDEGGDNHLHEDAIASATPPASTSSEVADADAQDELHISCQVLEALHLGPSTSWINSSSETPPPPTSPPSPTSRNKNALPLLNSLAPSLATASAAASSSADDHNCSRTTTLQQINDARRCRICLQSAQELDDAFRARQLRRELSKVEADLEKRRQRLLRRRRARTSAAAWVNPNSNSDGPRRRSVEQEVLEERERQIREELDALLARSAAVVLPILEEDLQGPHNYVEDHDRNTQVSNEENAVPNMLVGGPGSTTASRAASMGTTSRPSASSTSSAGGHGRLISVPGLCGCTGSSGDICTDCLGECVRTKLEKTLVHRPWGDLQNRIEGDRYKNRDHPLNCELCCRPFAFERLHPGFAAMADGPGNANNSERSNLMPAGCDDHLSASDLRLMILRLAASANAHEQLRCAAAAHEETTARRAWRSGDGPGSAAGGSAAAGAWRSSPSAQPSATAGSVPHFLVPVSSVSALVLQPMQGGSGSGTEQILPSPPRRSLVFLQRTTRPLVQNGQSPSQGGGGGAQSQIAAAGRPRLSASVPAPTTRSPAPEAAAGRALLRAVFEQNSGLPPSVGAGTVTAGATPTATLRETFEQLSGLSPSVGAATAPASATPTAAQSGAVVPEDQRFLYYLTPAEVFVPVPPIPANAAEADVRAQIHRRMARQLGGVILPSAAPQSASAVAAAPPTGIAVRATPSPTTNAAPPGMQSAPAAPRVLRLGAPLFVLAAAAPGGAPTAVQLEVAGELFLQPRNNNITATETNVRLWGLAKLLKLAIREARVCDVMVLLHAIGARERQELALLRNTYGKTFLHLAAHFAAHPQPFHGLKPCGRSTTETQQQQIAVALLCAAAGPGDLDGDVVVGAEDKQLELLDQRDTGGQTAEDYAREHAAATGGLADFLAAARRRAETRQRRAAAAAASEARRRSRGLMTPGRRRRRSTSSGQGLRRTASSASTVLPSSSRSSLVADGSEVSEDEAAVGGTAEEEALAASEE